MIFIQSFLRSLWGNKLYVLIFIIGGYAGFWIGTWSEKLTHNDKSQILRDVSTAIQIDEVQDEIRNNRPDSDRVVERMRAGTF